MIPMMLGKKPHYVPEEGGTGGHAVTATAPLSSRIEVVELLTPRVNPPRMAQALVWVLRWKGETVAVLRLPLEAGTDSPDDTRADVAALLAALREVGTELPWTEWPRVWRRVAEEVREGGVRYFDGCLAAAREIRRKEELK